MSRIRLQFFLGDDGHKIGPGKIRLLEAIREHGSISGAARSMEMAYRHAWEMTDALNRCFDAPVVEAATGGQAGGGAHLTELGEAVVERYRRMERAARRAVGRDLSALEARVSGRRRAARRASAR